jgi:hypothetical protein
MDNVQNGHSYINTPLSQTYRSYQDDSTLQCVIISSLIESNITYQ